MELTDSHVRLVSQDDRFTGDTPGQTATFTIDHGGTVVGSCAVRTSEPRVGVLDWEVAPAYRGQGFAARAVRILVDWALTESGQQGVGLHRVEVSVRRDHDSALRVATRSGLRREGVTRRVDPETGRSTEYVLHGRLADDPPLSDPESFRTLLNSFLPRKRAIAQMLVRDPEDRVLLCHLTYKSDRDLPGGVVEVNESPHTAVSREVAEELDLEIPTGRLLLTDWLPAWSGWEDALCLVFDGGVHPADVVERITAQEREIRSAAFHRVEELDDLCADFTARRIRSALAVARGEADPGYAHSGRP